MIATETTTDGLPNQNRNPPNKSALTLKKFFLQTFFCQWFELKNRVRHRRCLRHWYCSNMVLILHISSFFYGVESSCTAGTLTKPTAKQAANLLRRKYIDTIDSMDTNAIYNFLSSTLAGCSVRLAVACIAGKS